MDRDAAKNNSPGTTRTKAFSLTGEDIAAVERIKAEEGALSDSAALRMLIRDGLKFRRLRRQAEQELMKRSLRGEPKPDRQALPDDGNSLFDAAP